MKKANRQRKRGTRGSAVVESALCFIVFAAMLLGTFDFGQFLFVHQALTERARYSARWGAVSDPTNTAAVINMVLYFQSTAPDNPNPYFGLTTDNVTASYLDDGTYNARLVVNIKDFKYYILSPYIGGQYTGPNIQVTVPVGQLD